MICLEKFIIFLSLIKLNYYYILSMAHIITLYVWWDTFGYYLNVTLSHNLYENLW